MDKEPPRQKVELWEKLAVDSCELHGKPEDMKQLPLVFCKPKLIPLKKVSTQQLEKMRKEQMEKATKVVEEQLEKMTLEQETKGVPKLVEVEDSDDDDDADKPSTSAGPSTSTGTTSTKKSEKKAADVWTAKD